MAKSSIFVAAFCLVTALLLGVAMGIVLSLIPVYLENKTVKLTVVPFSMNYSVSETLPEGQVSEAGRSLIVNQWLQSSDAQVNITIDSARVFTVGQSSRTNFDSRATQSVFLELRGRILPQSGCNPRCLRDFGNQFKRNLCTGALSFIP